MSTVRNRDRGTIQTRKVGVKIPYNAKETAYLYVYIPCIQMGTSNRPLLQDTEDQGDKLLNPLYCLLVKRLIQIHKFL